MRWRTLAQEPQAGSAASGEGVAAASDAPDPKGSKAAAPAATARGKGSDAARWAASHSRS